MEFEEGVVEEPDLNGAELAPTISRFQKSNPRPGCSSAVTALSDRELEPGPQPQPQSEPEPEPETEPEPELDVVPHGPHFEPERLCWAAKARATPIWWDSDATAACMWCEMRLSAKARQRDHHCHRCGWIVCEQCAPHRRHLDIWIDHDKPKVQFERSTEELRVCDACVRASQQPHAQLQFFLATYTRFSNTIAVHEIGPTRSEAVAEFKQASRSGSRTEGHALFEMLSGGHGPAHAVEKSWWLPIDEMQRKVEEFAARSVENGNIPTSMKKVGQMWLALPAETVWSEVSLDRRNFTLQISSALNAGAEYGEGDPGRTVPHTVSSTLHRYSSAANVNQSLSSDHLKRIHCADCLTVSANGQQLALDGLTVDNEKRDEPWTEVLICSGEAEAAEWRYEITILCERARSVNARFHRYRAEESKMRQQAHECLLLQRKQLDEQEVWGQFEGLDGKAQNELLRKLTKDPANRVSGAAWAPKTTRCCAYPGCKITFNVRHRMHHCRLCGGGVCNSHFSDTGVKMPATGGPECDEAVPPTQMQGLGTVEDVLGQSRLELLNTEVEVYSSSAHTWAVGRITNVDTTTGDTTISYTTQSATQLASREVTKESRIKTIKASDGHLIRPHERTQTSDLSLPVCTLCKSRLMTIEDLPLSAEADVIDRFMSAMAADFHMVKAAGPETPTTAQKLRSQWMRRQKVAQMDEVLFFQAWLEGQSNLDPIDISWIENMRAAGLQQPGVSTAAADAMNIVRLARDNITKMLAQMPDGLTALLVDKVTQGFLATSHTRRALAEQGVMNILTLEHSEGIRHHHRHMRAVVWVRLCEESLLLVIAELQSPRYAEYFICFCNRDKHRANQFMQQLAVADRFEVVRGIGECFGECVPISPQFFALEVAPAREKISYSESVRRLHSVLLSLGRDQPIIRYSGTSEEGQAIAHKLWRATRSSISATVRSEGATDNVGRIGKGESLLLIIDREDDPFTPLMNQWTMLAMIHELLVEDSCIGSSQLKFTATDGETAGQQHVISTLPPGMAAEFGTSFAQRHMHSDFGEMCENFEMLKADHIALKERIEELLRRSRENSDTLADAKEAVRLLNEKRENPQRQHDLQNVPLIQELNQRQTHQKAEMVSRFQITLVSSNYDAANPYENCEVHLDELILMLEGELATPPLDSAAFPGIQLQRLRAMLTFVLRYPTPPTSIKETKGAAWMQLCSTEEQMLVRYVASTSSGTTSPGWQAVIETDAATRRYNDCFDVDWRLWHRPRLESTLQHVVAHTLDEHAYPFVGDEAEVAAQQQRLHQHVHRKLDLIVFFIGGITCQEARIVHEFNREIERLRSSGQVGAGVGMRVICGGDFITSGARHCATLAERAKKVADETAAKEQEDGR